MADTESLGEAGVAWLERLAALPAAERRVLVPTITDPHRRTSTNQIRRCLPTADDKWSLEKVMGKIVGKKQCFWRAVDHHRLVLDIVVQIQRDQATATWLLRALLKTQMRPLRVIILDDPASYGQPR